MTNIENNVKEAVNSINCSWEDGEQTKIKQLGKEMQSLAPQKELLKNTTILLGEQQINRDGNSVDMSEFITKDVKNVLLPLKAERDAMSTSSKDRAAVKKFVDKIAMELKLCTTNKSDVVMAMQVYVNALNDYVGKHAVIPYKGFGYKEDTPNRLAVDGLLGPHTYNALWLAIFGEEIKECAITKEGPIGAIKEDGTIYLPGPDGRYKPFLYDQDKYSVSGKKGEKLVGKELPQHFQKMNLFLQFYEGWKEQALQVANTRNKLNSSWFSKEGKLMKEKIAAIDAFLQKGIAEVNANPGLQLAFPELFKKMAAVEDIEDVYGADDLADAKAVILKSKLDYDADELKLIGYSRRGLTDAVADSFGMAGGGNSEYAKKWLTDEKVLKKPEYIDITKALSDPQTLTYLQSGNITALTNQIRMGYILAANAQPIAKEMIEEYNKLLAKNAKFRGEFRKQITAVGKDKPTQDALVQQWNSINTANPASSWDDYINKATEEAIKTSTNVGSLLMLKDLMVEAKLTQQINAGKHLDPDLEKLKDILGVGNFNISDKNAEFVAEAGQTIALSAVTMGVGGLVARGALASVKWLATASRMTSALVKLEKAAVTGNRMVKGANALAKRGVKATKLGVEGVGFYQGSNVATNFITENEQGLLANAGDWKEMGKSVAFVGVLKVVGKFMGGNAKTLTSTNKGGWKLPSPKMPVAAEVLKNTGKLLVQGGVLVGASQGIEFVASGFDKEAWNPTWGEFFQACLLTRVMREAGKLDPAKKINITKEKGLIRIEQPTVGKELITLKQEIGKSSNKPKTTSATDRFASFTASESKLNSARNELNNAKIDHANATPEGKAAAAARLEKARNNYQALNNEYKGQKEALDVKTGEKKVNITSEKGLQVQLTLAESKLNQATIEKTNAEHDFNVAKAEVIRLQNENALNNTDAINAAQTRLKLAQAKMKTARSAYDNALSQRDALAKRQAETGNQTTTLRQDIKLIEKTGGVDAYTQGSKQENGKVTPSGDKTFINAPDIVEALKTGNFETLNFQKGETMLSLRAKGVESFMKNNIKTISDLVTFIEKNPKLFGGEARKSKLIEDLTDTKRTGVEKLTRFNKRAQSYREIAGDKSNTGFDMKGMIDAKVKTMLEIDA